MRFDPVRVADQGAWSATYGPSEPRYTVPLNRYHYLGISLRSGGFTRADWRADAQAADALLKSIRIESR